MLRTSTDEAGSTPPRRPSLGLLATEMSRATGERALLAALRPLLSAGPKGDGHPVVVLPGFTADDTSTGELRRFLRARGYYVHGWKLGRNVGPTTRILVGLEDRLAAVSDQHEQKCSIVGWSLGGTFARAIAKARPDSVRQVVTLGTPLRLDSLDQVAAGPLFKAMSSRYEPGALDAEGLAAEVEPLPMPSTSIYSRIDGFVPWQLCVAPPAPNQESVEVCGSHLGLAHNPAALAVIADRLAQPDGEWAPFQGSRLSRLVSPPRRRGRSTTAA